MKPHAFVMGGVEYQNLIESFGFKIVDKLRRSTDLLVLTGGTDINPSLYDQKKIEETGEPDNLRDAMEVANFNKAKNWGIPMYGICRGAQLLCVLNGGSLIQHVTGHDQSHEVILNSGKIITVTSSHHQMMDPFMSDEPFNGYTILARSHNPLSDTYKTSYGTLSSCTEVEALYYHKTRSLCTQFHPEWVRPEDEERRVVRMWLEQMIRN